MGFCHANRKHNGCHELDIRYHRLQSDILMEKIVGKQAKHTSKRRNGVKRRRIKNSKQLQGKKKFFVMRHIGGISRKWNGKKWKSLKEKKIESGRFRNRRVRMVAHRT